MQLSLSASLPISPEAAVTGASEIDTATGLSNQTAADATPVSFEELLPAGSPPARPTAEEEGPDVEKTASILAASFWMPTMSLPSEAQPELTASESVGCDVPAEADQTAARRGMFTFSNLGTPARSSAFFAGPTYQAGSSEASAPMISNPAGEIETSAAGLEQSVSAGAGKGVKSCQAEIPNDATGMTESDEPNTTTGTVVAEPAVAVKNDASTQTMSPDAPTTKGVGRNSTVSQRAAAVVAESAGPNTTTGTVVVEPIVADGIGQTGLRVSGRSVVAQASPEGLAALSVKNAASLQTMSPDVPATGTETNSTVPQRAAAVVVESAGPNTTTGTVVAEPIVASVVAQLGQTGLRVSGRSVVAQASPEGLAALAVKNAAGAQAMSQDPNAVKLPEKKDFLSTGHRAVIATGQSVGIDVADASVAMPAAQFNRAKFIPRVEAMVNMLAVGDTSPALNFTPEAPTPLVSPRETMAAVVNAVEALERSADSVQKSLDLQFNVGTERLALRVELRDGTVHTTFRAESPELRTALAHEWQAVMQPVAGRELRLADPVFSSAMTNGGESASGSLGQGAPHQRGQQAPEQGVFSRTSDFSDSPPPASTPATPAAATTTSLLQAFA